MLQNEHLNEAMKLPLSQETPPTQLCVSKEQRGARLTPAILRSRRHFSTQPFSAGGPSLPLALALPFVTVVVVVVLVVVLLVVVRAALVVAVVVVVSCTTAEIVGVADMPSRPSVMNCSCARSMRKSFRSRRSSNASAGSSTVSSAMRGSEMT